MQKINWKGIRPSETNEDEDCCITCDKYYVCQERVEVLAGDVSNYLAGPVDMESLIQYLIDNELCGIDKDENAELIAQWYTEEQSKNNVAV